MQNNTLLANVALDLLYQALESEFVASRESYIDNLGDQFVKAIARHRHWEREAAS